MLIRNATAADLPAIRKILDRSPEAGAWPQLNLDPSRQCLLSTAGQVVTGVLLASCPAPDDAEILTLAVDPAQRRRGAAYALVTAFLATRRGRVFLDVRPSNVAAQRLYVLCGFRETGRRRSYYQSPPEDAITMQVVCS